MKGHLCKRPNPSTQPGTAEQFRPAVDARQCSWRHLPAAAATPSLTSPETASQKTISWAEVGAAAGAQYSGDGLTVTPTRDGARLRCVFQRIEGEATREGLWLSSTVSNQGNDRFRVTAMAVGTLTAC